LLLGDALQNINAVPVEKIELSAVGFDFLAEFAQSFDHELHAVVGEIRVVLRDDLLGSKYENGSDSFVLYELQNQRSVIEEAKVAVEEK